MPTISITKIIHWYFCFYLGEDVIEFHTHGSRAVINALFDAISRVDDSGTIRIADRGEFIRRAFYNGKVKLSQVIISNI